MQKSWSQRRAAFACGRKAEVTVAPLLPDLSETCSRVKIMIIHSAALGFPLMCLIHHNERRLIKKTQSMFRGHICV